MFYPSYTKIINIIYFNIYPSNTFLYRTFYVVYLFYYYCPQISHIVHLDERDAIQKNVSVFKYLEVLFNRNYHGHKESLLQISTH